MNIKRLRKAMPQTSRSFVEVLENRIAPANFIVTSFLDDVSPGTLRQAIADANTSPGVDTIEFTKGGKIKLGSPLPAIIDDLEIAAGKSVTIDGARQHGILSVTGAGVDLVLQNLKLVNGRAVTGAALSIDAPGGGVVFTKGKISGNRATGDNDAPTDAAGGGIALFQGSLTIENSVISGNTADTLAVINDPDYGRVEVRNAAGTGGGIWVENGSVTIRGSKIIGNRATSAEGGAAHGGGIAMEDGTLTIENSTLAGNSATNFKRLAEGDDAASFAAFGGGLSAKDGVVTISGSSLISKNTAVGGEGSGGGIFAGADATVTITGGKFIKNTARGSDGFHGAKGAKGENGTRSTEPGEPGGDGGPGESGGNAGSAGFARGGAICSGGDVTLVDTIITGNAAIGGRGGNGGNGGAGGIGGAGGPGSRYCDYGTCYTNPPGSRGYGGYGGNGGNAGAGGRAAGGAIFNAGGGSVTIEGTTISGNASKAGLHGTPGRGGAGGGGGAARGEDGARADGPDTPALVASGGGIENLGTLVIAEGSTLSRNSATGFAAHGGGIANSNTDASLQLEDSVVSKNKIQASSGRSGKNGANGAAGSRGAPGEDGEEGGQGGDGEAGVNGGDALGGGIYNIGIATIENSTISGNAAAAGNGGNGGNGGAGGLGGAGGRGSRYCDEYGCYTGPSGSRGANGGGGNGGNAGSAGIGAGAGIFNAAANTAAPDAPPVLDGGSLTILNTTIASNKLKTASPGKPGKAGLRGGDSAVPGEAAAPVRDGGGGIFTENGALNITQSTVAKNSSSSDGGGILGSESTVRVINSTIAFNKTSREAGGLFADGGTVDIISSIIAANKAARSLPEKADVSGAFAATASLIGISTGGTITGSGNILDTDARLGKLANNGGTVLTILAKDDSPAINAGSNSDSLVSDQRGDPRVKGGITDIGAIEVK